jgi:chemotaxis methyl-accepting protein methylase
LPPLPRGSRPATSGPTVEDLAVAAFPVVGIGCSAGGLEALGLFLSHVPAASAAAYVIVQHLAPDHPSALPELLRRSTAMPVAEATDGLALRPGRVYVIPPRHDLSLRRGHLHLQEPAAARGLRLPIDVFLRSLAEDRGARAIGVVLSGMGSDGVLGLAAIRAQGGLTLAQEPASAEAGSMPASAIAAGVVDIVATPEALPARIAEHLRHLTQAGALEHLPESKVRSALDRIVGLLRERSGNDFSLYKTNTLYRRIERRMAVHQIAAFEDYAEHLRGNVHEQDLLFKELLIGVTRFFRDPEVWEVLRDQALPALLKQLPDRGNLRAWVAGCSTGEEAYTLAMVFREAVERHWPAGRLSLQIYATDLDPDAIDSARKGLFPEGIAVDVSAERLLRFFAPETGGGWRIVKDIRETVVFATQNVVSDPPFTKLDILACRNLLIYFGPQLQKQVLPLFHYALRPGGLLLLGSAETVGGFAPLFAPLQPRARLYRRLDQPRAVAALEFPSGRPRPAPESAVPAASPRVEDIGQLTDRLIQQTWAPAAVLVNGEGDILYFSGRTGKYLEPAAGKTNMNVHAMAREGLRKALVGALRRAQGEPQPVRVKGLHVGSAGATQAIDLVVQALDKPEALRGHLIIVFQDLPALPPRRRTGKAEASMSADALRQELQLARQALEVTREDMQTTLEELRSSNEELQSTNEELQSTNEELTTSKEELQSLNEELQTVNAELQSKVDDLTGVRNDMSNLLNSIEIATVFLDREMRLRRYTPHATRLFKLIPGDVGRPLADVVTDLEYPQMRTDAIEVLHSLAFRETVAGTADGRCYRVRIMPYRTQDNVIDGIVITFTDITEIKKLELELRRRGA